MNWWLIAGGYIGLGLLVISLCPYKKHYLSSEADFSNVPKWKMYTAYTIMFLIAVMCWPVWTKMFYTEPPPSNVFEAVQDLVTGHYQSSFNLPSETIQRIQSEVMQEFRKVADLRNEHIPGEALMNISAKFMHLYKKFGEEMYTSHLEYELEKYKNEGLREDYTSQYTT